MKLKRIVFIISMINILFINQTYSAIIKVPYEFQTIQEAINQSEKGDTILVDNGTYYENILIDAKEIVLTSNFIFTNDVRDIKSTILNGNKNDFVLKINNTNVYTQVIGFTIENGQDGVTAYGQFTFKNNIVRNNIDGIDYENNSGGICRNNLFEQNRDDGIDLDQAVDIIIEQNIIRNNKDDGIEIRLHKYAGNLLNIVIENNLILNNEEDGIQIIDYPDVSDRQILIRNNIISNSSMAAIGYMSDGNTKENYEAAQILERILIFNNTLVNNTYGITGGGNSIILNNIISHTKHIALKGVKGNSISAYQNFYKNGINFSDCNIDENTVSYVNPKFKEKYFLPDNSPLLNQGIQEFLFNNEMFKIQSISEKESIGIGCEQDGFSSWLHQLEGY